MKITIAASHEYETDDETGRQEEKFNWCNHELDIISPALNDLHRIVRDEIWKQDAEERN